MSSVNNNIVPSDSALNLISSSFETKIYNQLRNCVAMCAGLTAILEKGMDSGGLTLDETEHATGLAALLQEKLDTQSVIYLEDSSRAKLL